MSCSSAHTFRYVTSICTEPIQSEYNVQTYGDGWSIGVRGILDILKSLSKNFGLVSLGIEECCFDADSDEMLQFLYEACCFILQQQRQSRLKKYRQWSCTCVMLEFPHRYRPVHTGLLLQQKYRNLLSWEDNQSEETLKPILKKGGSSH